MYQPHGAPPGYGFPQQGFSAQQQGFQNSGMAAMTNGNHKLPRSESMYSSTSAIIAGAEEIRQRYKRILPEDLEEGDKDYKTMVHTLSPEKLASCLRTKFSNGGACDRDPAGLKEAQAREFEKVHGENRITPPKKKNKWLKLLELTFTGVFNYLLWACIAAQVVLLVHKVMSTKPKAETGEEQIEEKDSEDADYVTPILLALVVIMAAVLQWQAEQAAEDQMEAMQKMQPNSDISVVRRADDGSRLDTYIDPANLVPGDICFLSAGDKVPADVRIIHCSDGMEVDNAALTGEAMPEPRKANVEGKGTSCMEARNLAFYGTLVVKGNATCVVHAIGDQTFLGKIAESIKSSRTQSTLEVQIIHFVHIIAVVAVIIGVLSFIANLLSPTKRSAEQIMQNSFAALFAQVPEGLLPTVTISLMIASDQMAKREVLVRNIDSVETLGCVTVFCSDKTGTLTKGEMTVQDLVVPVGKANTIGSEGLKVVNRTGDEQFPTDPALAEIVRCGILNNAAEAKLNDHGELNWIGSPTEKAILTACTEMNGSVDEMKALKSKPENRQVFDIPFNSENKWMLTIHGSQQQATVVLKGAPDRVLKFCSVQDDVAAKAKIEKAMQDLMSQARRVLCIAKSTVPVQAKYEGTNEKDCNFPLRNFEFVGLFGIEDPPKEGVDDAILKAQKAGVRVVMVTGDHPETARAIARRINILKTSDTDLEEAKEFTVITGKDMESRVPKGDDFDEDESEELVDWWQKATRHALVFARVSPIHKQVIVQAYQKYGFDGYGDICAMTGDGVNDAPALKAAKVGIAMNSGTEVAKDASDIVLLDNYFPSVINGIEQGRLSSENLQKSIMYTLCSKVPQVAPTFAELFGIPPALTVAQVLLIDIGTDIWTAIAFALQAPESRLMERKPRHPLLEKLVNWKVLVYSYGYIGPMQMFFCWLMYYLTPGIRELLSSGRIPCDSSIVDRTSCYNDADPTTVAKGRTVYYWTLVLAQIAAAISSTTKLQSVFGFFGYPYCFPNMTLNVMFLGELLLGLGAIYNGFMQQCFDTTWIKTGTVLSSILALVGICFVEEVRKLIGRLIENAHEREADDSDFDSGSEEVTDSLLEKGSEEGSGSETDSTRPLLC